MVCRNSIHRAALMQCLSYNFTGCSFIVIIILECYFNSGSEWVVWTVLSYFLLLYVFTEDGLSVGTGLGILLPFAFLQYMVQTKRLAQMHLGRRISILSLLEYVVSRALLEPLRLACMLSLVVHPGIRIQN